MTTLFAIAAQYREDVARLADLDLDEQTLADTLESLGGEIEIKAQNVAHVIRVIEAESEACATWAKDANNRARAAASRALALRKMLGDTLQGLGMTKVSGPGVSISFRASTAIEIDDAAQIPNEFMRHKPAPPPEIDKVAIAAALRVGRIVPGARVEQRKTLSIK